MDNNYWARYWRNRLTRRTLLRTTAVGAGGLVTAAVVGCGDDEEVPGATTPAATATPAATTPGATATPGPTATEAPPAITRGGRYITGGSTRSPTTTDPHKKGGGAYRSTVNSRLFTRETGPDFELWGSPGVPDAVDTFEQPEPTVLIVKLKPNVVFGHPISRAMTADDVIYSFSRYTGGIEGVPESPEGGATKRIFKSWTKIDDLTVRFDLKQPQANLLYWMSASYTPFLMPENADKLYDVDNVAVGSGPWRVQNFTNDVTLVLERNPDWFGGPERPYLDQTESLVSGDYTSRLTQFLGGNFMSLVNVPGGDLKRLQDTIEGVQLILNLVGDPVNMSGLTFSPERITPNAPWRDPRVRQAISMAIDRDAMTEAAYDISILQARGLDVEVEWNGFIPVAMREFWNDPKRVGPNKMDPESAQYFAYDPEGARNLLKEAGYEGGFSGGPFWYINIFGPGSITIAELTAQYLAQVGINFDLSVADYRGYYVPSIRNTGDYEGMALVPFGTFGEPGEVLVGMYVPGGNRNNGQIDDPVLTAQISDIEQDLDPPSRRQKILDLQNDLALKMYYVPMQAGAAPVATAYQPYVQNAVTHISRQAYNNSYYWLDL